MKISSFIYQIMLCSFVSFTANAQLEKPVKWSYAAKRTSATEATVYIKPTLDAGWHIYSTAQGDDGPTKTSFSFLPSSGYKLIGKISEPKPIKKYESVFKMDVLYFEKTVVFTQKVKLLAKQATVKGTVEYMACSDKMCLPPDEVAFSIVVK